MRSNYRRLGDYIELVNDLNREVKYGESDVCGVSNNKEIIKTKANNIGRDFSKFYIVAPNDFIYNSRTSRMGDKVGLGFNDSNGTYITSFNNTVFRINNEKLLPSYLFMWFKRPEFDRYARYHSWGSSTELFSWDDMCNVEIPVPSIEKQREIVREYNVVNDRIALNEQRTQKLEATAQAIYKQWFVDFEFPTSKEYAESIGKPELEGKPYKSSGGEMKYSERIEADVPAIWKTQILDDVLELIIDHRGKTPLKLGGEWSDSGFPAISAKNIKKGQIVQRNTIRFVDSALYAKWMKEPLKTDDLIMTSEAPMGELLYICSKTDYLLSQRLYALRTKKQCVSGVYLYFWLQNPIAFRDMEGRASGTTVLGIKQSELRKVNILTPDSSADRKYFELMAPLFNQKEILSNEKAALKELAQVLLVKLSRY